MLQMNPREMLKKMSAKVSGMKRVMRSRVARLVERRLFTTFRSRWTGVIFSLCRRLISTTRSPWKASICAHSKLGGSSGGEQQRGGQVRRGERDKRRGGVRARCSTRGSCVVGSEETRQRSSRDGVHKAIDETAMKRLGADVTCIGSI